MSLAVPYLSSQHWMLEAAAISTDGATGAIRVAGLGMAYAWVFRTWLEDDDPGLAKTMAALDRRLRRGERVLGSIERFDAAVSRFAAALGEFRRSAAGGRSKSSAPADPEVGQV
jgi:ubiquinone biosynthesis protein COQ9